MKKCQYCAEEIQDAAIVCRWCGRDLVENVEEIARTRTDIVVADEAVERGEYLPDELEILLANRRRSADKTVERGEYLPPQLREIPESKETDEPIHALNPHKKQKKESSQEIDEPASPLNPHPHTNKNEEKGRTPVFLIAMPIGLLLATLASIGTAANRATLFEKYGYSAFSPIFTDMVCHFITNAVIWTLVAAFLIFIFRKIF